MNTCLVHGQSYPQDGWCVYCGPPIHVSISSVWTGTGGPGPSVIIATTTDPKDGTTWWFGEEGQ